MRMSKWTELVAGMMEYRAETDTQLDVGHSAKDEMSKAGCVETSQRLL